MDKLKTIGQAFIPGNEGANQYSDIRKRIDEMKLSSLVVDELETMNKMSVVRYAQSVSLGVLWGIYLHLSTTTNISANDTRANKLMEEIDKLYSFSKNPYEINDHTDT